MTTLSIASGGRGHVAIRKDLEHLNRKHQFALNIHTPVPSDAL